MTPFTEDDVRQLWREDAFGTLDRDGLLAVFAERDEARELLATAVNDRDRIASERDALAEARDALAAQVSVLREAVVDALTLESLSQPTWGEVRDRVLAALSANAGAEVLAARDARVRAAAIEAALAVAIDYAPAERDRERLTQRLRALRPTHPSAAPGDKEQP
jgi:hypothetical protein